MLGFWKIPPIPQRWKNIFLRFATNKQVQTNAPGKNRTVRFVQNSWVKRKVTLQNHPLPFKWYKTLGPLSQRKRAASAPIWSSLEDLELRKEITGGVDSLERFPPFFGPMNHSPQTWSSNGIRFKWNKKDREKMTFVINIIHFFLGGLCLSGIFGRGATWSSTNLFSQLAQLCCFNKKIRKSNWWESQTWTKHFHTN